MDKQTKPFLNSISDWRTTIKLKTIFLDADTIIAIRSYKADAIMQEFDKQEATCMTINPVRIELQRTNNPVERNAREVLLESHGVTDYPFFNDSEIMKRVGEIRMYLQNYNRYPAPADLYLAATIAKFSHNQQTYLLTGNTNDFPTPLFKRIGYIVLQAQFGYKILVFLSVDTSILDSFNKSATITKK